MLSFLLATDYRADNETDTNHTSETSALVHETFPKIESMNDNTYLQSDLVNVPTNDGIETSKNLASKNWIL